MDLFHHSVMKPSTYSATISTDQIIITRHEYNSLVESKYRLGQANDTITDLKGEVTMLKEVLQRFMTFYGTSGNGAPNLVLEANEDSKGNQNDLTKLRSRGTKATIRRDSGVDGIDVDESFEENEPRPPNQGSISKPLSVKRSESVSYPPRKRPEQIEPNLLDLDDDDDATPTPVRSRQTDKRNITHESTDDQAEKKSQLYSRVAAAAFQAESPVAKSSSPSSVSRRETEPQPRPQLGYESPVDEEERAPTPASWERASAPNVTFDDFNTNDSEWTRSADWNPNPEKEKDTEKDNEKKEKATGTGAWTSETPFQLLRTKVEELSPSPPKTPVTPSSLKTARQLYLEKKLARAMSEARSESRVDSSGASSSGDIDKLMSEPDPSSYRHIYIPNLPANATLATLSSIIRTNGQGGIEFISLFRQKTENGDFPNFEDSGVGENIGVNITFTTSEACDAWFKFLFENSSQKLQGNPTKTWLFPNDDSAAEWKKCAVFRRSDYHPSIAGKIDKGGPGGHAALAEAQKKGATRVLLVTGLPPDVTESDLAYLSLPPGNRSSTYDGPTHLASGQAGLSTEEFARWKWLEKITIEDEEPMGFGDGGDRRKTARIYAAGVKTAYLARGKIWKKYNRNGTLLGKSSGGYVKVEFDKDECEGPLEELPPWVVVGGDDDDFGSVGMGGDDD